MPKGSPIISDDDFIREFTTSGPSALARRLGIKERGVFSRRRRLERQLRTVIASPQASRNPAAVPAVPVTAPGRLEFEVKNGVVLVGSDAHYQPENVTTAHRAFVKFCKEIKPVAVMMNGDMIDAGTISRHPPIGWENKPSLVQEIEACQQRLHEIELASGKAALFWQLGNHDARFSTRLATLAPEYANVHGTELKDHFGPRWKPCWSVWVNGDVVVKHRYKGGIHSTHNSPLWAGKTTICGHLHSLNVRAHTDYTGTRFGVDTGTLADPFGPQFEYLEDSPRNWRSGFVVLTFSGGRLLWPEIVHVLDSEKGLFEFRAKVYNV